MKIPTLTLPTISGKLRSTFIEGWLYWYTAFGVTAQEFLSSEEAYKYCNPVLLFWIRMFLGSSVAGFNAVKAFRSMTYGRAYGTPPDEPLPSKTITIPLVTPPETPQAPQSPTIPTNP